MYSRGEVISQESIRQNCVALSSTEAEQVASDEGCTELIQIERVLEESEFEENQPISTMKTANVVALVKSS